MTRTIETVVVPGPKAGMMKCTTHGEKCKQKNHFSMVCMSSQVNYLENKHSDCDNDAEYTFMLQMQLAKSPHFKVLMNSSPIKVLTDTGASINLNTDNDYFPQSKKPVLNASPTQVYICGAGTTIRTREEFQADLQVKHQR